MALPTAIVMPRQAVYLAFMKSMRDPLSKSRIADIIDQARGKGPADLVIKSVGIFDLTSGEMAAGDIAIAGDRIVGTYETYSGATEIDGRGLIAVPGFIDSPRPLRIDPGARRWSSTAASCRAAPRRRSAIRTRSATCWASPA